MPHKQARTLSDLRRSRNLTQEALAMLGGVTAATISRIEAGEARATPQTIVRLAQALGVGARRMANLCDQAWRDREQRDTNPVAEKLRQVDIGAMAGER